MSASIQQLYTIHQCPHAWDINILDHHFSFRKGTVPSLTSMHLMKLKFHEKPSKLSSIPSLAEK